MRLPATAAILLSFISLTAHSKIVYRSGNWALNDLSADAVPQNICAMVQDARVGNTVWQVQITHTKNEAGPTEIFLTQTGRGAATWSVTTTSGQTLAFANMSQVGTTTTLWHIPQNTSAFIAHLDGRRDMQAKPADGTRINGFKIFDSGFASVKAEMVKRCLGTIPLVDAEFETAFLKRTTTLNPNAIAPETVTDLRALLVEGHKAFLGRKSNAAAMLTLRNRFAAPLQESQSLTATIATLTQTAIPTIRQQQTDNDALEERSKTEVQRLTGIIPGQEQAAAAAKVARDNAHAILAPHIPEHNALESEVEAAESEIVSSQTRIAQIDQELSTNTSRIRSLESDLSSHESTLRQHESNLRQAESRVRQAESEYRSFNPSSELRNRLQNNYSYRNATSAFERARSDYSTAQRDADSVEREVESARREARAAASDRDSKQSALDSCRRTPEAECRAEHDAWKVAKVMADRAEDEYQRVDGRASTARMRISSARSEMDRARSDMDSAERSVEREVDQVYSQLRSTLDSAQRRHDELSTIVRNSESRIREIGYELPRLRDQVSSLERERPLLVSQVSRARSDAARAESALASFEQRVGWRAKKQAYDAAENTRYARANELNTSLRAKAAGEQAIQRAQTERPRLAQELATRQQQLTTAQERHAIVKASLAEFEVENAQLTQTSQTLEAEFLGLIAQFEGKLPN